MSSVLFPALGLALGALYGLWFQLKYNKAMTALAAADAELVATQGQLALAREALAQRDAALADAIAREREEMKDALKDPARAADVLRDLGLHGYEAGNPVRQAALPDRQETGNAPILGASRR